MTSELRLSDVLYAQTTMLLPLARCLATAICQAADEAGAR